MGISEDRASLNSLISSNINDAFKKVELVADNIAEVIAVANELLAGDGLHPEYYTQVMADSIFAAINSTYTKGESDAKYATVLNFNSTGITDAAQDTVITINSANNIGINVVPGSWKADQSALQLGGLSSIYATTAIDISSGFVLGHNYTLTADNTLKRVVIGPASQYFQSNGAHVFNTIPAATIASITTAVNNIFYFIETVGDSDFTLIGASSNTVGTKFLATGAGSGTGTLSEVDISAFVTGVTVNADATVSIPNLVFTDTNNDYTSVTVDAALSEIITNLAAITAGKGASLIGVEDTGALFTGSSIEAVLAEIVNNYASVAAGLGASKIGVEDSASNFTATTIETVLNELAIKTVLGADLENDIALPGNPTTTTQTPGDNSTRIATTAYIDSIGVATIDNIYPVGAVFISTVSTNPQTYLGGTWVSFGEGRMLISQSGGYPAGNTGGEATHTLTTSEMPSHEHNLQFLAVAHGTGEDSPNAVGTESATSGTVREMSANHKAKATGSGTAHNNIPPYISVYMWKRTA